MGMLLYEVDGKTLSATQAFVYLTDKLAFANARIAELEAQVAQAARLQVEMSGTDPLYPLHLLAHDERHQRNINAFLDGVQP